MMLDPAHRIPTTGLWKRIGCIALVVGVVTVIVWFGAKVVNDLARVGDRSNVGNVISRQRQAWNEGDLEGLMAEYWQSDDLTFFSGGTVTKGWQATLDRYRKRYQAEGKEMGQLTFDEIKVDVMSSDAAVVRGQWKVVTSKDTFEGLFTLLLRKIDGKWKIVHDHTSAADVRKPAEAAGQKQ